MPEFFIRTFGCQMNKSDSERIAGVLIENGYSRAADPERADVILFNTCCVRKHAEDRLLGNVNALRALKRKRKDLVIAIGGCYAQKQKEQLFSLLPHVDLVFGTHNASNLPALIEAAQRNGRNICEIREADSVLPTRLPVDRDSKLFGWIPVSVGCDNHCTYCVVPSVRGSEVSLPLEEIVREAEGFAAEGGKEITLLGQNVNSYGRDLYGGSRFDLLLKKLDGIEGLERIRFTTSHPKDLNDAIIEAIVGCAKVCGHIHLPVQAGSDRILELMNRGYTSSEYMAIVEKIKSKIPSCGLTTDIMVGFPGEEERDFKQTLSVVNNAMFDQAFMFIYSPREGTPALELPGQVGEEQKKERFLRLVELQDRITWELNKGMIGLKFKLLVEGRAKKDRNMFFGRTDSNKVVNFQASDVMEGSMVETEVIEAHKKSLVGRVC